jgi:hypothetical protein
LSANLTVPEMGKNKYKIWINIRMDIKSTENREHTCILTKHTSNSSLFYWSNSTCQIQNLCNVY